MQFIQNNIAIILLVLTSGLMLLWPIIGSRISGIKAVDDTTHAFGGPNMLFAKRGITKDLIAKLKLLHCRANFAHFPDTSVT